MLRRKVRIEWSPNFAYAIGLITSDGNLSKDKRHISLVSKEAEMLVNFKNSLCLKNKICKRSTKDTDRGEKNICFCVYVGDMVFYEFLNSIGLTSAKSKTIKHVEVPQPRFPDFLRGLFDGDGSFYTFQDKRWPNSFSFKLSIASASLDFLYWLKSKLTEYYGVKGYMHKGTGVWNLEYVKGDTKKLFYIMYHPGHSLRLNRKYCKIKDAIDQDKHLGLPYLQKPRKPE